MKNPLNSGDHLGQHLAFEDNLPLNCQVVEALPLGNEYLAFQISNEETLHAIMMVEDASKENSDEGSTDTQDILRLEYKINIMFELLTGLYQREAQLPPSVDVILRSNAIQWCSTEPMEIGNHVLVDLYISSKYPKPLVLAGTVTAIGDELCPLLTVTFDDAVSERSRDWIDKFIFRHHRRAVALARRQSRNAS